MEWREASLGQLIHIKHGYPFESEHFSLVGGQYVVLTPGNFYETGGFLLRPDKDRYYTGDFPREYILKRDDLIIAMTEQTYGLLGSPACIPCDDRFLHNQRLGLVKIKDAKVVFKRYLYYLLFTKRIREEISNSASGTKIRHTAPERVYRCKVLLPSFPVQKKIAAVLTAYDDLIENNNRRIAILEKMAEEIYREWFVRMRFPGHERAKFHKGVPEGWEYPPSSAVLRVMGGGTPKTDIPGYWNGDIPFFTPKDTDDGFYVSDTEKHVTEDGLNSCSSSLYKKNTIFITARGTVGKIVLCPGDMTMNQSCYALAPKQDKEVYFCFLALRDSIKYIKGISKSGVFDNIIIDTFDAIPLVRPASDLVTQFNALMKPLFESLGVLMKANNRLIPSRDLLLSRLITGKLSVEDLDIQFPSSMRSPEPVEGKEADG